MVKINGVETQAAGMHLSDYLVSAGYNLQRVAVERNLEIVPRRLYEELILEDGDDLEIVGFVGGG